MQYYVLGQLEFVIIQSGQMLNTKQLRKEEIYKKRAKLCKHGQGPINIQINRFASLYWKLQIDIKLQQKIFVLCDISHFHSGNMCIYMLTYSNRASLRYFEALSKTFKWIFFYCLNIYFILLTLYRIFLFKFYFSCLLRCKIIN